MGNFGQILTFWGLLYDPLLSMTAKFGVVEETQVIRLPAKFGLDRFILSTSGGKKKQILPFWTSAFCSLASSRQSEKVKQWIHNYKPSPIEPYQNGFCTPTPSWRKWAHKL